MGEGGWEQGSVTESEILLHVYTVALGVGAGEGPPEDHVTGPGASTSLVPQNPEGGICREDNGCTPGKAERKAQGKTSPFLSPPQPHCLCLPLCAPHLSKLFPTKSVYPALILALGSHAAEVHHAVGPQRLLSCYRRSHRQMRALQ